MAPACSGGFRELCLPICRALGVSPKNLFANRMNWQVDDDTGAHVLACKAPNCMRLPALARHA